MNADLRGLVEELLRHRVGELPLRGWLADNDASRAVLHKLADALSVAQGQGFVPDKETIKFAMTASRLLQGFMLDTNAVGAREAGVNLARGIKDYLAAAPAQPDGVSK